LTDKAPAQSREIQVRGGTVDLVRRVIRRPSETRPLTGKEVQLLAWMAARPGVPVTRETLLVELWGYSANMVTRTVDVTIRRLRMKIEEDPSRPEHILTLHGQGYVFEPLPEEPPLPGAPTPATTPAAGPATAPEPAPAPPSALAPETTPGGHTPGGHTPGGHGAVAATEIVDASASWESRPDGMTAALSLHDQILQAHADAAKAHSLHKLGDQARAVFADLDAAIQWAVAVQSAVAAASWPEGIDGLSLRIGVFAGTNRHALPASRLAAAGHGGQVLVVGPVEQRPAHPTLRSLGEHLLPDLLHPVEVFEAVAPDAPARSLPLRAPRAVRTNLGADPGSRDGLFLGRERDVAAVRALLNDAPLVTVTGPGGMGKTRLARWIAAASLPAMPGGVWFVDLAPCRTSDEVLSAIATALGVPLGGGTGVDPSGHLLQVLGSRGAALLVLDNFEQLVTTATPLIARLVRDVGDSRLLVTSREALRVSGERRHVLPPLETGPGVELFIERAREAAPDFSPGPDARADIAALVVRLEGSPLALALAAARTGVLSPKQIMARLDQPFRVLRGTRGADGDRHASLRAVVEWSWALLTDAERDCLAQCTCFQAPFTLEAAEETLSVSGDLWVDEVLEALRDKSLLHGATGADGALLLAPYQAVRAFAEPHLSADQAAEVRARHAAYFLRLGEAKVDSLNGPGGLEARLVLQRITPDLHAVFAHTRAQSPERAVRAVLALAPALTALGPAERIGALLDQALELARDGAPRLRARVHLARSLARRVAAAREGRADLEAARAIAVDIGDRGLEIDVLEAMGRERAAVGAGQEALDVLTEARTASLALEDPLRLAQVEGALAQAAFLAGDAETALDAAERALHGSRAFEDRHEEAEVLGMRGVLFHHQLRLDEALADLQAAAAVNRAMGDRVALATDLTWMGAVHGDANRDTEARAAFAQALDLNRQVGNRRGEGFTLGFLAWLELATGNIEAARTCCLQAVPIHRAQGNRTSLGYDVGLLGTIEVALGQVAVGRAHLDEAVEALVGVGEKRISAVRQVIHGMWAISNGDPHAAAARFAQARDVLEVGQGYTPRGSLDVLDGFVVLARGGPEARAQARTYLARGGDPPNLDVRVARVLLEVGTRP
jgi:predicted ATPase/DNA-binding winged helix-turn-helix (wHTH) protein